MVSLEWSQAKLDGVDPVDNRPFTTSLYHFVKIFFLNDMSQVTRDMWHVTRDMWHMACDRWGDVNLLSKSQLPSSYGLGVKVFEDFFTKDQSLT